MNHIENYTHFVNSVFGDGAISLSENSQHRNEVIGAIDRFYKTGEYYFFTANLKQRFCRLNRKYKNDSSNFPELINKIKGLATKEWKGYYSELVAYDYFSLFTKVEMEVSVLSESTMASYIPGRNNSSVDGRLPELFNVAFEIKTFGDKNKELVEGIINQVSKNNNTIQITANYAHDMDYQKMQKNRGKICKELAEAIKTNKRSYQNSQIPEISFNIFYTKPHILTTEHPYNQYRQAKELKYFVLNHFDQLFLNEVNLIVYVVHPWFNFINSIDFLQNSIFFQKSLL